jgi:uncharacterized protein (DUF2252 family)
MAESPFAFYRGAAAIMANDLGSTPDTGLVVQACGDAHLANFGTYASADRRQVFDVNDFDETLPGPWEWDLKRLATSFVLAARENGFSKSEVRRVTEQSVAGYRRAMARFAAEPILDTWYFQMSLEDIAKATLKEDERALIEKQATKFRSKGSLRALSKLAEKVDGKYQIKSQPPLLIPLRDLPASEKPEQLSAEVQASIDSYRESLPDHRRALFDKFEFVDAAAKVVGVGSVGTRCLIGLFQGRDDGDPLFLQMKEATHSVLERHLPGSPYAEHGERVVRGQHLMQTSSDIFLGWGTVPGSGKHFYWRQLHDMKGSAKPETMNEERLGEYAEVCGATLAHAHARTADPIVIAGYIGSGSVLDEAIAEFAFRYAKQNESDHAAFLEAIESGKVAVADG